MDRKSRILFENAQVPTFRPSLRRLFFRYRGASWRIHEYTVCAASEMREYRGRVRDPWDCLKL